MFFLTMMLLDGSAGLVTFCDLAFGVHAAFQLNHANSVNQHSLAAPQILVVLFPLGFTLSILVELNNLRDPAIILLPMLYKVALQEANTAAIDSVQNPVSCKSRLFLAIIVENLNFSDPSVLGSTSFAPLNQNNTTLHYGCFFALM
jgi:hypothetical protein